MSDFDTMLRLLREQFPDQLLIGVEAVAKVFNVKPKTVYNGISRKALKKFPVQPVSGPGKKFRLTDIARALAEM